MPEIWVSKLADPIVFCHISRKFKKMNDQARKLNACMYALLKKGWEI
jgi:hypothetical protein